MPIGIGIVSGLGLGIGLGPGEGHNIHVVVRGNRVGPVQLLRAVSIELPQPDGEELHDLPGVVLIRVLPRVVMGFVLDIAQVSAHHRGVGDLA